MRHVLATFKCAANGISPTDSPTAMRTAGCVYFSCLQPCQRPAIHTENTCPETYLKMITHARTQCIHFRYAFSRVESMAKAQAQDRRRAVRRCKWILSLSSHFLTCHKKTLQRSSGFRSQRSSRSDKIESYTLAYDFLCRLEHSWSPRAQKCEKVFLDVPFLTDLFCAGLLPTIV